MHKFSIDLNNKVRDLSELRVKYAHTENESEKAALAPRIMELEKKNMEMKQLLSIKAIEVRNAEIKFIQNKK